MAIDRNDTEERQVRLDAMIAEFRTAQQRRLVKVGKALSTRSERAESAAALYPLPLALPVPLN
jgi:hypothetical protein